MTLARLWARCGYSRTTLSLYEELDRCGATEPQKHVIYDTWAHFAPHSMLAPNISNEHFITWPNAAPRCSCGWTNQPLPAHRWLVIDDRTKRERHRGERVQYKVECSCGWSSGWRASAGDAQMAGYGHVEKETR